MEDISNTLKDHYKKKFLEFGPTAKGVDWGNDQDVLFRHKLMYNLILNDHYNTHNKSSASLLDVGCGYGAFCEFLEKNSCDVDYTGIDVVEEMIAYAKQNHPSAKFSVGDFMSVENTGEYDYIICNGILTQKLTTSIIEMDRFANNLMTKMYSKARKGIAFNIMSSKVNFMVANLYYRHPADILTFCLNELSTKVRIEHSYPMYEYTVYVYKTQV
jgi:SAM-dependent methyltransferase